MDGVKKVTDEELGEVQEEAASSDHFHPEVCDCLHTTVHDAENSPMMRAVLSRHVCKVYRFQTEDQRWLLVREQMSETPLSFSVPKLLLSVLRRDHASKIQEVMDLGDLSLHMEKLRGDVIAHCNQLIGWYDDALSELDRQAASCSFKSSSSRSERNLQFVPTNLHTQRMEVSSRDTPGVWYDVITVGAPADHHQAFKHGGLRRLLNKHCPDGHSCLSFSPAEALRARGLLEDVARLQPLVFGLAEELLAVSKDGNALRLQQVLDNLSNQTEQFVHTIKDELVKTALLAIHHQLSARCHGDASQAHSNGTLHTHLPESAEETLQEREQDQGQCDVQYDDEEWDRAWVNVALSLSCIIAMVDRLLGREERSREATLSQSQALTPSWEEQMLPLVVTLRDCVREAVAKASTAMTFVILHGIAAESVALGPAPLVLRRHSVFSQALSAVVCGFMVKLHTCLGDAKFLQQLHTLGILVQFEGLVSTYGDELGMLEDMEVGVADLCSVSFMITEAQTDEQKELLPMLSGSWGSFIVWVPLPSEMFKSLPLELKGGQPIRIHPVLFNIGINQQQSLAERFGDSSLQERINQESCEHLKAYCDTLRDVLPDMAGIQSLATLLTSLDCNIESKKRKNVEVLWTAAAICRVVNGVRLTSCKSAKDRTSMSVTLEQCLLLRERHALGQQHFSTALDSMRRSRLSWRQISGCYTRLELSVSGQRSEYALKAPQHHVYPVAFLMVTSHLLVLWLIFSLLTLTAKPQEGCRMDNVLKNIGSRKFAFSSVQLLTFPKLYRPPDGTY